MKKLAEAYIPTPYGRMHMMAYAKNMDDKQPTVVLRHDKNNNVTENVPLRIHSECMTGDIFHSLRCDCGEQLEHAMKYLQKEGGIIIYLRQEGRGIGLIEKLKAYNLQEEGLDTVDANIELGFEPDGRLYDEAITILHDLKIKSVKLLTNNPEKVKAIEESGIELSERIPVLIKPGPDNKSYLEVKKNKLNQWL